MAYCAKMPDGSYEWVLTKEEMMALGGLALSKFAELVAEKRQADEESK